MQNLNYVSNTRYHIVQATIILIIILYMLLVIDLFSSNTVNSTYLINCFPSYFILGDDYEFASIISEFVSVKLYLQFCRSNYFLY
jgi:hypothetical protein